MNLYIHKFDGINPVGAVAIAVARNADEAARLLTEKLAEHPAQELHHTVDPDGLRMIGTDEAGAAILLDGEY